MSKSCPIPRRTFLKGLGTAIALPVLESMMPRMSAAASGAAVSKPLPKRMAFVYVPNGANMDDWTPRGVGAEFELPYILEPLKGHQRELLVLSGLADLPIVFAFLSIGILLWVFYQIHPDPHLPHKNPQVFAYYILHELPAGVRGLLVAGLFRNLKASAAQMSPPLWCNQIQIGSAPCVHRLLAALALRLALLA